MTERFNAPSQQTTIGSSEIGPTEIVTNLSSVGVGQGSGQTATKQENNSFINFEFPIKWDDLAGNLGSLGVPKNLEQTIDDMTTRDRELEDFLNTNIVNGIIAGSNIAINRASGVVTISSSVPTGPQGPQGAAATIAVGTTTTGAAGTQAAVTNSGTSSAAVFNFAIPRGAQGAQGPGSTVSIGTTTTGAAGTQAAVSNSGTSSAAIFNFTIPKGDTGATGSKGDKGDTGSQGPQGASGTSGWKTGTSVVTLNTFGIQTIAHGMGSTPSTVILVNGDTNVTTAAAGVRTWDATNIYVQFAGLGASTVRVNWIAIP